MQLCEPLKGNSGDSDIVLGVDRKIPEEFGYWGDLILHGRCLQNQVNECWGGRWISDYCMHGISLPNLSQLAEESDFISVLNHLPP